jgi:hypothetical protein
MKKIINMKNKFAAILAVTPAKRQMSAVERSFIMPLTISGNLQLPFNQKILALTVTTAFMLVACAKEPKEPTVITMTTKASELRFSVAGGTTDFAIDWGDGKKSNVNDAIFENLPGSFVFAHEYSDATAHHIVITGNVTGLSCAAGNRLTALDVSRNTVLTDLNCSNNQLTALDVSKNIALNDLECNHNQITKLDVSKNTVLWALSCVGNQFTAAALNDLFGTLPDKKTETEKYGGVIFISYSGKPEAGNPGNRDCDRSIAEKRGWVFMTIK